jgi:hypothetical protein
MQYQCNGRLIHFLNETVTSFELQQGQRLSILAPLYETQVEYGVILKIIIKNSLVATYVSASAPVTQSFQFPSPSPCKVRR